MWLGGEFATGLCREAPNDISRKQQRQVGSGRLERAELSQRSRGTNVFGVGEGVRDYRIRKKVATNIFHTLASSHGTNLPWSPPS